MPSVIRNMQSRRPDVNVDCVRAFGPATGPRWLRPPSQPSLPRSMNSKQETSVFERAVRQGGQRLAVVIVSTADGRQPGWLYQSIAAARRGPSTQTVDLVRGGGPSRIALENEADRGGHRRVAFELRHPGHGHELG